MKIKFLSFTLLLAFSTIFFSCGEGSTSDQATDEMARETENSFSTVGAELKGESDELAREFESFQGKINFRMEEIESELKDADEETKIKLQKQLDRLENYRSKLDARMGMVGDNMESGWKSFKGDIKNGWGEFAEKSEGFLEEVEMALDPKE